MRELNDIVASVVERYQKAGNKVRFSRGELPPQPLRSTAMSRLIANLIDNALAYGAPPVEVVTRADGGAAVLEISDRGPGIAPDQVPRLKRPFTRGEPARTGGAGAGLGLAIVERIARLHVALSPPVLGPVHPRSAANRGEAAGRDARASGPFRRTDTRPALPCRD